MSQDAETVALEDSFQGDTANLIRSIEALIALDHKGVLVPHGIGGHARELLSAAAVRLAAAEARLAELGAGTWYAGEDIDRLVREMDVALNGEDGAAKQAMLVDVVAQVKHEGWRLVRRAALQPEKPADIVEEPQP